MIMKSSSDAEHQGIDDEGQRRFVSRENRMLNAMAVD
jgi:hypothetical protein